MACPPCSARTTQKGRPAPVSSTTLPCISPVLWAVPCAAAASASIAIIVRACFIIVGVLFPMMMPPSPGSHKRSWNTLRGGQCACSPTTGLMMRLQLLRHHLLHPRHHLLHQVLDAALEGHHAAGAAAAAAAERYGEDAVGEGLEGDVAAVRRHGRAHVLVQHADDLFVGRSGRGGVG